MSETRPAITFNAHNADAYEQVMGRWSRRLAPLLIGFGGVADGDRVLDVGCGTGSLTFALPHLAEIAAITGIDQSEAYVNFARAQNTDPRITIEQADARALPYADATFDRTYSMLVLQFIPDADRTVAEMRRVVRAGGTVAAAVWDSFSGLPFVRMMFDAAAVADPTFSWPPPRPLGAPGEMASLWQDLGLIEVEQTSLLIRMEFSDFEDYWRPFTTGEGPPGKFVASLSDAARATLITYLRRAYLSGAPDGPRSFVSVAWACRGTVPK